MSSELKKTIALAQIQQLIVEYGLTKDEVITYLEKRSATIRAIANKAADRNDGALRRLDDNLKLDYDVHTKEENEQYNKENEDFWKGK